MIGDMINGVSVKIKLCHPLAKLPEYKTSGSSGMDIYSVEDKVLYPHKTERIQTGVALQIPEGYEVQVRPRSGLACKNVVAQFGTIDSDFRDPLQAIITNIGETEFQVHAGDRIAQLVLVPVTKCVFEQVDELDQTGRGGYGSTGMK